MRGKNPSEAGGSPVAKLEQLVQQALAVTKKARKHRDSLSGDNYYANKLAELRADATNLYRELNRVSAGDSSALAEMLESVFAPKTPPKDRSSAVRDVLFSLRTTWHTSDSSIPEDEGLFPLSILSQAGRGYLVTVARQMNGCFCQGWYDASAVMMRRLLEVVIIEAFEANGIADKITDSSGDYFHLSDLVSLSLQETAWKLSRNCKKFLPQLRDAGHESAHGRYYHARREDLERLSHACRIVLEEFLHHAALL